ncbi:MAG: DUF3300 domain-containing protein [Phycisphaerae bacterium]|nr:DUF3300 domain-containing protein [Phycisphaerae bacterium]
MLIRLVLASLLAALFLVHSIADAAGTAQTLPDRIPGNAPTGLSDEDLQELVAPIAVYPDPLLSIMLEASLFPDDVAAAVAFVRAGGTAEQAAQRDWDEAVIALVAIPDALAMLHDYGDWAAALGTAFLTQSEALMGAVQEMRRRAWDNGALFTTPQQVVVREEQTIIIQPANPQVIYVPVFNPHVIYAPVVIVGPRPRPDPVAVALIGFGVGIVVGGVIWANSGCNWRISGCWGSRCWNRPPHGGGNNTNINVNINNPRPPSAGWPRPGGDRETWRPAPDRPGQGRDFLNRQGGAVDRWRGVGDGSATSAPRIPGRQGNTPIARPSVPSAGGSRPSLPANRPAVPSPPAGGANRPSLPSGPSGNRPSLPSGSNLNRPSGSGGAFDQNRSFPSGGSSVGQGNRIGGGNQSRPAMRPAPSQPARPIGGGGRIGGAGSGGGSFGGGRLGGRR